MSEPRRAGEIGRTLALLALQGALVAGAVVLGLGAGRSLRVPLAFQDDAMVFLAQCKSTLDSGWWWTNARLGAPGVFHPILFPSNTNVDQAIVRIVGLVVRDPMRAVTAAWIAMLVAGGWGATYGFRLLGCSRLAAFVAGALFALSPYALYRHVGHFSLVTYLVPYPATLAVLLASGRVPDARRWRTVPLFAGCVLLGFDYVYYAFFACFFVGVGAVAGWLRSRDVRVAGAGAAALAIIALCTGLNLVPSFVAMRAEGKPTIVRSKVPAEAEVYGLKLRQLVSPVFEHELPPLRRWTEKEAVARFPVETENMVSRLGTVASLGFVGLLVVLLLARARTEDDPVHAAARLATAGVLLATVGGFGSLFNLLVTPDIRAYNRICPFLVVFALLAVASAVDAASRRRRRWGAVLALAALGLGVWDQVQALRPLREATSRIASEYRPLVALVSRLETLLPPGTMVLQLPFTTFLNDEGRARMLPYDHFKPYLASRSLRWSYPALSDAQYRWQEAASKLDLPSLAALAGWQGFGAIWVDKRGYADGGAGTLAALSSVPGARVILDDERYAVLAIPPSAPPTAPRGQPLQEFLQDRPVTPSLRPCGEAPRTCLDQLGEPGTRCAPAGPERIEASRSRDLVVSGWAVTPDNQAGIDLELAVDAAPVPVFYGFERPDVAASLGTAAARPSGFRVVLRRGTIPAGPHALTFRLLVRDRACYLETSPFPLEVR